jgi:uncharacterized protein (TIGR01777 family)
MPPIVVAGGTGLLGTALVRALRADGNHVVVLTRHPTREGEVLWSPDSVTAGWASTLDGAAAVINLAGTSIADGRWTRARKTAILESRTLPTGALVRAIAASRQPPRVFISSSAIGIYGNRVDEPVSEDTDAGSDFLASVCREWEAIAHQATASSRVVLLRTGVALARTGGALPQLALPFRLFAGGPLGSGRQYVSWIHLHDWVAMVQWALATEEVAGPLNLTAPAPVTNAEFARMLGHVLKRPAWITTPAFALRLALGEMADALVLGGQRVLPEVAQKHGFVFRYPTLEPALREIFGT